MRTHNHQGVWVPWLLLGYHDLHRAQMTTERVIWTLATFSTHQGHNPGQEGHGCTGRPMKQSGNHRTNLEVLKHSTGLLAMYQGLQGLQTWAWTKLKGPLRHQHLLNPQRLLKEHQDTLTHICWHQWQSIQHAILTKFTQFANARWRWKTRLR